MRSLTACSILLVCCLATFALKAYEQPPSGAKAPSQSELQALLSGNSHKGVWAGRAYLQHFSPHGSTRYQEEKGAVTVGRWRVNEQGHYCSVWPPSSNWVCYKVLIAGEEIYWQSGDGYYKARTIPGDVFAQ